jgi:hypothetical protein
MMMMMTTTTTTTTTAMTMKMMMSDQSHFHPRFSFHDLSCLCSLRLPIIKFSLSLGLAILFLVLQ